MKDIHSKHQYFHENLQIEKEKLIVLRKDISQFETDVANGFYTFGRDCYKCWLSLDKLNFQSIYSSMEFKNKPIKKLYDETRRIFSYHIRVFAHHIRLSAGSK